MRIAPTISPKEVFTPQEWAELQRRSDWRGLGMVAHAWGLIGVALTLFTIWPNPLTWLLAVLVVAGRQLGLAILMHEAAHGGLSRSHRLNDWVGQWLCGIPVGADLSLYRNYHLAHHKYTQQPTDPDLGLAAHFPIGAGSFRRKVVRDLSGQTFFKQQLMPLLGALFGKLEGGRRQAVLCWGAAQVVIGAGLTVIGAGPAFWLVWLVAMATVYPLITRIRNIGEHAAVTNDPNDPWQLARTTIASPLERLLLAPYWVNFHAEHHLWMHVPCYRLKRAHELLRSKGKTDKMVIAQGYRQVFEETVQAPS